MFLLFAAEPGATHEPDDQPSSMDRLKATMRKGAEEAGPVLKKAASLTLSGAKKAGVAGVALTKTVASRVRNEIATRRAEESNAGQNGAEATADGQASAEEAATEDTAEK